jgi:hypothetical protein
MVWSPPEKVFYARSICVSREVNSVTGDGIKQLDDGFAQTFDSAIRDEVSSDLIDFQD